MIYILKNPEPPGLRQYKADKRKRHETPEWSQFSGENGDRTYENEFEELRISLVKEQRYICCYCQQEIAFKDEHTGKLQMKTEHFEPKGGENAVTEKQLDYSNLLAACLGNTDTEQEKHCDSYKLGKLLRGIPNPSNGRQKNFKPCFKYQVRVKQKEVVVLPIVESELLQLDIEKVLNLNEQSLRSKRFSIWNSVSKQISSKHGDLKISLIERLLEIYTPANQDKYRPFCGFIESWLKEHLKQLKAM